MLDSERADRWLRRAGKAVGGAAALVVVSAASIWLAVQLTPMQSVSAAGQTVQVGAARPGTSLSGPGELDLFGEAIATRPHFDGPIRPRLKLAHIDLGSQIDDAAHNGGDELLPVLSRRLASGWLRYCLWESLIAAGCAATIAVAVAGVRRDSRRTMVAMTAAAVASVCVANAVGVYLLASGTPRVLRQVRTLDDLVGRTPAQPVPAAKGEELTGVRLVVLGDSTAAGIGNRLVDHPTPADRTCGRSADSYAADLAAVNDWKVLNLACQGATVTDGILGVQTRGDDVIPPQLAVAQRATGASTVIVSIGANDLNWAVLTGLCARSPVCDDKASTAYFTEQLAAFTQNYLDLLQQLSDLPHHPDVIVNDYYEPFGPDTGCLKKDGITPAKAQVLRSRLADLNTVLENGAEAFHFTSVRPRFDGHRLCSKQPFVQNSADKAPLHPTAAGELAIALADQQALSQLQQPGYAEPSPSADPPPASP
ncbi:SGNH/GDSL hydrolase family protein [Streptomyces cocklensis]|uniref:GDSL-like Lipase/Acylhydrolase family protein n=1 Tax=Actinacidiphila cocklensis TaxID=887465 RepID=A0A9W4GWV0_9ACTN|nr:SGNH/GDSL hydrolase family protein [Actinacidiphila cocklensis]MDD1063497.1 SGNH/GDSL hydrolase family protein [Actinacidiphila cocklensis]CAG6398095.1 GDSL-like Lipase/Acylhydrolase family protein [Actinacidiphila cocklensis]